jgi:hypothetical protein
VSYIFWCAFLRWWQWTGLCCAASWRPARACASQSVGSCPRSAVFVAAPTQLKIRALQFGRVCASQSAGSCPRSVVFVAAPTQLKIRALQFGRVCASQSVGSCPRSVVFVAAPGQFKIIALKFLSLKGQSHEI